MSQDVSFPVDAGLLDHGVRPDVALSPDAAVPDQGTNDAQTTPDMGAEQVELARCEDPLGGEPWSNMPVEATPGIEMDLAAVDTTDLPDEIDISGMNGIFRGIIAYSLDVRPEALGPTLRKVDLVRGGPMGKVVAASLALGQGTAGGIDFLFLRRGLHRYYHCGRDFPKTLDGFKQAILNYDSVGSSTIDSIAKCGERRLIVDEDAGVYVAETLVDGVLRETEILLDGRRRDGNLDFLIYNAAGQLSDRTQFPTVGMGPHVYAASPYVCTTCHMNRDRTETTFGYDRLFPDVGPCAP